MKIFAFNLVFFFYQTAFAATYNMYWNNIEQGSNSSANPNLNVNGDKVKGATATNSSNTKKADQNENSDSDSDLDDKVIPAVQSFTQYEKIEPRNDPQTLHKHKFQVGVLGFVTGYNLTKDDFGSSKDLTGANLNIAYFPLRDLGIAGFVGKGEHVIYGGEVEFNPIRITFLGKEDFVKLGLLAGVSNMMIEDQAHGHVGLRATVQFSDRFGINAGYRTNITERDLSQYNMGEIGLRVAI